MTREEYLKICVKFAKDTKNWGELGNKFYTTYNSSWIESTDNEHGGIDVSWAFHQSPDYIKEHAIEEFLDNFQTAMNLLEDAETKETALRTALIIKELFTSAAVYDANAAADEVDSILLM